MREENYAARSVFILDVYLPIGSMTWLGYINGIHVTIYGSTMDPSWVKTPASRSGFAEKTKHNTRKKKNHIGTWLAWHEHDIVEVQQRSIGLVLPSPSSRVTEVPGTEVVKMMAMMGVKVVLMWFRCLGRAMVHGMDNGWLLFFLTWV